MSDRPTLLGTEVLYKQRSFSVERKYYQGHCGDIPGEVFVNGWSGRETMVTETVIDRLGCLMLGIMGITDGSD